MINLNVLKKRIDELGRIVIPKQIRNSLKINSFDELEIYVKNENIVLKKTIGLEMYKEKLDRLLNCLKSEEFKIIITDKNNVISSNLSAVQYRNEFLVNENEEYIENSKFMGYIKVFKLIIDSNSLGTIYFISNQKLDDKIDQLKLIKELVIDLIK